MGKSFQKKLPCPSFPLTLILWSPTIKCSLSLPIVLGVPKLSGSASEISAGWLFLVGKVFHIKTFALRVAVATSFSPSVQTAQGHSIVLFGLTSCPCPCPASFISISAGCPLFAGKLFQIRSRSL